jgi:hypothetical protein
MSLVRTGSSNTAVGDALPISYRDSVLGFAIVEFLTCSTIASKNIFRM